LLNFCFSTCVGQFLLDLLSLLLGDGLLNRLRCALDQLLGFLQAQASDATHGLNHANLIVAKRLQDNVELGLLSSSGSTGTIATARSCSDNNTATRRLDSVDFLQVIRQCLCLE